MIIVVDANIVFSALITPAGKLAKVIAQPSLHAQLISGNYLLEELGKHHQKIVRFSKRPEQEVFDLKHSYLKHIQLYDEKLIQEKHWLTAENLTNGVDNFDVSYVALSLQTDGYLWTGDKKLYEHLKSMGFEKVVNTVELTLLLNLDGIA